MEEQAGEEEELELERVEEEGQQARILMVGFGDREGRALLGMEVLEEAEVGVEGRRGWGLGFRRHANKVEVSRQSSWWRKGRSWGCGEI